MISNLWNKLTKIWNEKGAAICLGLGIAFLLLFALYNKIKGGKGTYSKNGQYYVLPSSKSRSIHKKQRPRESKGEAECRRVLQNIFRKPFPTQRPNFLLNPVTGGNFNLELDCYNSDLHLAVEYNGIQHYKYTPYFHKNKEHFLNQKYRDDMKRRICRENQILLIEVPYTVKLQDIEGYLINKCRQAGYKV